MAKKYVNYRVGGTPEKKDENYTVWSNDLLSKLKDEYSLSTGDVILAEEGDYIKVINESDHDQLVYLRIFDKPGWRDRASKSDK